MCKWYVIFCVIYSCIFLSMLENIRIVLVNMLYIGNIGFIVWVMKIMGLSNLYLVDLVSLFDGKVSVLVVGVGDVLVNVKIVSKLEEVVVGCGLVVGMLVCLRILSWFMLELCSCGEKLIKEVDNYLVVLVFGCENNGFINEEF